MWLAADNSYSLVTFFIFRGTKAHPPLFKTPDTTRFIWFWRFFQRYTGESLSLDLYMIDGWLRIALLWPRPLCSDWLPLNANEIWHVFSLLLELWSCNFIYRPKGTCVLWSFRPAISFFFTPKHLIVASGCIWTKGGNIVVSSAELWLS